MQEPAPPSAPSTATESTNVPSPSRSGNSRWGIQPPAVNLSPDDDSTSRAPTDKLSATGSFRGRRFIPSADGSPAASPMLSKELSTPDRPGAAVKPPVSAASPMAGLSTSTTGNRDRSGHPPLSPQTRDQGSFKLTRQASGDANSNGMQGVSKRVFTLENFRAPSGRVPRASDPSGAPPRGSSTVPQSTDITVFTQQDAEGDESMVDAEAEDPEAGTLRSAVMRTSCSPSKPAAWQLRRCCLHPTAGGCLVRCYIQRVKPTFMGPTFFKMFLESGDVFLLASRKRVKCKASQYLIALTTEGIKRDNEESVAKLKSDLSGWSHTLCSRGGSFPPQAFHEEEVVVSFRHDPTRRTYSTLREVFVAMPRPPVSSTHTPPLHFTTAEAPPPPPPSPPVASLLETAASHQQQQQQQQQERERDEGLEGGGLSRPDGGSSTAASPSRRAAAPIEGTAVINTTPAPPASPAPSPAQKLSSTTSWKLRRTLTNPTALADDQQPTGSSAADNAGGIKGWGLQACLERALAKELPPHVEQSLLGRPPGCATRVLQLVAYDHNSSARGRDVILQFGKLRSGLYALDFTAPFSARVAFAVGG
ncbi:MAG: hypothetical protein WDW38_005443 [Sanguina aurantia]